MASTAMLSLDFLALNSLIYAIDLLWSCRFLMHLKMKLPLEHFGFTNFMLSL